MTFAEFDAARNNYDSNDLLWIICDDDTAGIMCCAPNPIDGDNGFLFIGTERHQTLVPLAFVQHVRLYSEIVTERVMKRLQDRKQGQ